MSTDQNQTYETSPKALLSLARNNLLDRTTELIGIHKDIVDNGQTALEEVISSLSNTLSENEKLQLRTSFLDKFAQTSKNIIRQTLDEIYHDEQLSVMIAFFEKYPWATKTIFDFTACVSDNINKSLETVVLSILGNRNLDEMITNE